MLTAHDQPFRGARDLVFCLNVPLDSLLIWACSEGSGETARMRRLAWTFAARIGYKYQIRLTRSICKWWVTSTLGWRYNRTHYHDLNFCFLVKHIPKKKACIFAIKDNPCEWKKLKFFFFCFFFIRSELMFLKSVCLQLIWLKFVSSTVKLPAEGTPCFKCLLLVLEEGYAYL